MSRLATKTVAVTQVLSPFQQGELWGSGQREKTMQAAIAKKREENAAVEEALSTWIKMATDQGKLAYPDGELEARGRFLAGAVKGFYPRPFQHPVAQNLPFDIGPNRLRLIICILKAMEPTPKQTEVLLRGVATAFQLREEDSMRMPLAQCILVYVVGRLLYGEALIETAQLLTGTAEYLFPEDIEGRITAMQPFIEKTLSDLKSSNILRGDPHQRGAQAAFLADEILPMRWYQQYPFILPEAAREAYHTVYVELLLLAGHLFSAHQKHSPILEGFFDGMQYRRTIQRYSYRELERWHDLVDYLNECAVPMTRESFYVNSRGEGTF